MVARFALVLAVSLATRAWADPEAARCEAACRERDASCAKLAGVRKTELEPARRRCVEGCTRTGQVRYACTEPASPDSRSGREARKALLDSLSREPVSDTFGAGGLGRTKGGEDTQAPPPVGTKTGSLLGRGGGPGTGGAAGTGRGAINWPTRARPDSLAVQTLGVEGALDRPTMVMLFRHMRPAMMECWHRASGPLNSGVAELKLSIAPDGTVSAADLQRSTLANPPLEACLAATLRQQRFPAPTDQKGAVVSIEVVFTRGEPPASTSPTP